MSTRYFVECQRRRDDGQLVEILTESHTTLEAALATVAQHQQEPWHSVRLTQTDTPPLVGGKELLAAGWLYQTASRKGAAHPS
jgi:hypothetical protein